MNVMATLPDALDSPATIADLMAGLAAPQKLIENEFLQMGEKLVACTRLLKGTCDAYARMSGALSGSEFAELTQSLSQVSEHVAKLHHDRTATEAFLTELNDLTRELRPRIDAMSCSARTLRMYFVTARVVATEIGNRENNLQQFADEFWKSGNLLENNMESFAGAFECMRGSLEDAIAMNEGFSAEHEELLDRIAAEQGRNLEAMESRRLWAESRVAAHGERSERINARVSRAVSTLQVGDNTHQRVEHVEAMCQKLTGVEDRASSLTLSALMAAQLDGAVQHFDAEIAALAGSLNELVCDTEEMLRNAAADTETLLSNGDTALGAIDDSLHQITRMFEQFARSNAALCVAIDQLVKSVGNMLGHMSAFEGIRQMVRFLSLNATIKAKVLDEDGRAFRQVAKDLRSLNDEASRPVEEVIEKLEKSHVILQGFLDARASSEAADSDALQETLDGSRQRVAEIAGLLRDRAAIIAETGAGGLAQLRDAASAVMEQQDFCRTWRATAEKLAAFAPSSDLQECTAHDVQADVFTEIFATYTMKAERDIHNALLGLESDPPPSSNGEGEGAGLDDIFF